MKLFILALGLILSANSIAEAQNISAATQKRIRDQNKAYAAYVKSLAISGGSSDSVTGSGSSVTAGGSTSDEKAFVVHTVHPSLAGYCKDVNGPGGTTLIASIKVASMGYSCIQVRCDADLNFNQILDINEYVGLASPCQENTLTGQPYTQADCPGIWVVDYIQSGSGYLETGSCHSDNEANRANVFNRLECNIPGFATTTVHSTARLCVPANAQFYINDNQQNIPDINRIINGEIHADCLHYYENVAANPFVSLACTQGGVTDYVCARNMTNSAVAPASIDGTSTTVSCADQLDAYFNVAQRCSVTPKPTWCP